ARSMPPPPGKSNLKTKAIKATRKQKPTKGNKRQHKTIKSNKKQQNKKAILVEKNKPKMKNVRKQSLAVLLLHVPSELQFRIGDPSKPSVHSPKPNEPAAVCWNIALLKKSIGQKSWSQVPDTIDQ